MLQQPSSEGRQRRPKCCATCKLFFNINIAHQTRRARVFFALRHLCPWDKLACCVQRNFGSQERSRDSVTCPSQSLVIARLLLRKIITFSGGMFRQHDDKPARSASWYLEPDKSSLPSGAHPHSSHSVPSLRSLCAREATCNIARLTADTRLDSGLINPNSLNFASTSVTASLTLLSNQDYNLFTFKEISAYVGG